VGELYTFSSTTLRRAELQEKLLAGTISRRETWDLIELDRAHKKLRALRADLIASVARETPRKARLRVVK